MAITTYDVPFSAPPLPGNDLNPKAEFFLSGSQAWLDVSNRIFYDSVTLQRGGPDESTTVTASILSATLDNHDGMLSTLNPVSPYYGELGMNAPIRVSVPNGSTMLLLEADRVSGAQCASTTAINNAISGAGFELWIDADLDNWWDQQFLMSKWATNEESFFLGTDGTGKLVFDLTTGGTSTPGHLAVSTAALPLVHGRMSIRMSYVKATGTVTFYTQIGGGYGSWTQLGSALSLGALTPYTGAVAKLQVGWCTDPSDLGQVGAQGIIYAAALLNAVGGGLSSIVAAADLTQRSVGTVGWNDGVSNTWGVVGTAVVWDRNYRFFGESAAWPQSWTNGSPNARISLQAGGLLRRLGTVNLPLNSVMYRAFTRNSELGQTPIIYWPCEDAAGATQLASATPGGNPMVITGGVNAASSSVFNCSDALPVTNSGSITGYAPAYIPGAGIGNGTIVRWLMSMSSPEAANAVIARFSFTGGVVGHVDFINGGGSGSYTWNTYDHNGNSLATTSWSQDITKPLWWSLEYLNSSSGHVTINFVNLALGVSNGSTGGVLGSTAGTVGSLTSVRFNPDTAHLTTSTSIGHVSLQSLDTSIFIGQNAINAYDGEKAGIRFQRLCSEESINFRFMGNLNDTQPMGVQTLETIISLLQECVDADQGIWYEPRQCLGWGYRTRASLANQAIAVTFDANQDHLSGSLEPTTDDQILKNDITLTSQFDGSSARATLDDGTPAAGGSITSITSVGRYDTAVTQNIDSRYLGVSVGWLLRRLSCGIPRFKSIECDLANGALASMYYAILQMDIGDRLNIIHPPPWLPADAIDQLVKGSQEVISSTAFIPTWNTIPALPFNVIYLDTPAAYSRVDTAYARLTNVITAVQTSFSVTSLALGPFWSTAGGDVPFNIRVEDEVMTVTAVTGASTPQTFTVTRSVNGVVTTHQNGVFFYLDPEPVISL